MFYFYRYYFNPANIVTMQTDACSDTIKILLITGETVIICCSDYQQVQEREKEFLEKFQKTLDKSR